MTDAEYLRGLAEHCSAIEANRLRAIAARIEAMEKDAARYRWWRDNWTSIAGTHDEIDANIDAAMKAD